MEEDLAHATQKLFKLAPIDRPPDRSVLLYQHLEQLGGVPLGREQDQMYEVGHRAFIYGNFNGWFVGSWSNFVRHFCCWVGLEQRGEFVESGIGITQVLET